MKQIKGGNYLGWPRWIITEIEKTEFYNSEAFVWLLQGKNIQSPAAKIRSFVICRGRNFAVYLSISGNFRKWKARNSSVIQNLSIWIFSSVFQPQSWSLVQFSHGSDQLLNKSKVANVPWFIRPRFFTGQASMSSVFWFAIWIVF